MRVACFSTEVSIFAKLAYRKSMGVILGDVDGLSPKNRKSSKICYLTAKLTRF
jgi:hypothetical protein